MARRRRIVRKTAPRATGRFDEALWPVQVALAVLGGLLAGLVIAYVKLGAWFWISLAAIAVVIGAAMFSAGRIDSRLVRRAVMFSLLVAISAHVAMLVVFQQTRIFGRLWVDAASYADLVDEAPIEATPTYIPAVEETPPELERPVETSLPEPAVSQSTADDAQSESPLPVPGAPWGDQAPAPAPLAAVAERSEAFQPTPRQSPTPSRLGRQASESQAEVSVAVSAPSSTGAASDLPAREIAPSALVRKREDESLTIRRSVDQAPVESQENPELKIARRQEDARSVPDTTAAAALPRRLDSPAFAPRSQIQADAAVAAQSRQTNPAAISPQNTAASQLVTASPEPRPQETPPLPSALEVGRPGAARRRLEAPIEPQVARQLNERLAGPSRATLRDQAAIDATAQSAPAETSSEAAVAAAVTPSAAANLQRSAASPEVDSPPASSEAPDSEAVAVDGGRAARAAEDRTMLPDAAPRESPALARVSAAERRSPTNADRPAVAQAPTTAASAGLGPTAMALSKGVSGAAGGGRSPNTDRALPAGESPSLIASGAASRAQAVQNTPEGAAFSPSAPARVPRAVAGAEAPSSTRLATSDAASSAGLPQVSPVDASASAALSQARSSAAQAEHTAAAGVGEFDLGPTRIVTEGGAGRGAGGGQPRLSAGSTSARLERSSLGGAEVVALAARVRAETVEAPSGAGGGSPAPARAEGLSDAVSISRTQSQGAAASPTEGATPAEASSADALARGDASASRGEQTAGLAGEPQIGGGVEGVERDGGAPQFAANTRADQPSLAGGLESSGAPAGVDFAAQGTDPAKIATGVDLSTRVEGPFGALAAETAFEGGAGSEAGIVAGQRAASAGDDDVPSLADAFHAGAPRRDTVGPGLPGGVVTEVQSPGAAADAAAAVATADAQSPIGGLNIGPLSRGEASAARADLPAPESTPGLGSDFAADAGIPNRNASLDSQLVLPSATRFTGEKASGLPNMSTLAVTPTDAFRQRSLGIRKGAGAGDNQDGFYSPQTEQAIEDGLAFLARHQSPDGSWRLHNFGAGRQGYVLEQSQLATDTAATALSLLAFQGAGYNHREHKHQPAVLGGIQWLLEHQHPSGDLYVKIDNESNRYVWLYSHSIAALALCEAYGMTQDPMLKDPAQRALDFIVASQNEARGGWRYSPGLGSDTSVTGWMMMALKSGELAGLTVPKETYQRIDRWLDMAQASPEERHLYRYNPHAPDTAEQRHGRGPTPSMTSVGLLMRLYTGWRRDHQDMRRGADYLLEHLPTIGAVNSPQRDTYYWYYGTQVMYHMGGDHWKRWSEALRPLLLESQTPSGPLAGSWDPRLPVPDRWGPQAGRIYVTTMNLLSLEVHYRHLPLYEATAK